MYGELYIAIWLSFRADFVMLSSSVLIQNDMFCVESGKKPASLIEVYFPRTVLKVCFRTQHGAIRSVLLR